MATVSDFGSLEIKQLRVQNDISAVRYGTEIMDKDLIFKVGDVSNPNQSIRFSVHDGESYKDAFSVDSNGFAVSDLAMSGPSSGVIGIDELVKLGEMRVQHFNDHNNERAGEIIFSVNIGDSDIRTVDILSLSPEEVEITTASRIHGVLSCSNLNTSTVEINGNEFRPVIASFNHPLGSNTVKIERDESGTVMFNGPLKSEECSVNLLNNDSCYSNKIFSSFCSVSTLNVKHWVVSESEGDLSIIGPGRLETNDLVARARIESELVHCEQVNCSSLSVSSVYSNKCIFSALSTSQLYIKSVDCGDHLHLANARSMTLGNTTMRIEDDMLRIGSKLIFSDEDVVCGGLRCSNGDLSASTLECHQITSSSILTSELSVASRVVCEDMSVGQNCIANMVVCDRIVSSELSTSDFVGSGNFNFSNNFNFIKFDENSLETNVLISRELSCSSVLTDEIVVSNMSCSNFAASQLDARNATLSLVVSNEFYSDICSVNVIDTSHVRLKETSLRSVYNSLDISSGVITPSVSTHSLQLNQLNFAGEYGNASLSIKSDGGLVLNSDMICSGVTKGDSAVYNSLSCANIECENLVLSNHNFSTNTSFSIDVTGANASTLVFSSSGLLLDGGASSMKLSNDDSELVLSQNCLKTSGVFEISCSKLCLPETYLNELSVGVLTTSCINSPSSVVINSDLMCTNLSVQSLVSSDNIISNTITTQNVLSEEITVGIAQGVKKVSGPGGDEIEFETGSISSKTSNFMIYSESPDISFNIESSSSQFAIQNKNGDIRISSSEDIVFERNLSVCEITSHVVNAQSIFTNHDLLISAESTRIKSDVIIDKSCIVEHIISENMSCSNVTTGSIQDLSFVQSKNVHFMEGNGEDYLTISRESVVIGNQQDYKTNARLDVIALPFRDGIRVTSDDISTIKLQTKRNQRRGMILMNERAEGLSDEWMIGVGNYPLEKEDTFGVYFNDDSYLQLDSNKNKIFNEFQ